MKYKLLIAIIYSAYCLNILPGYFDAKEADDEASAGAHRTQQIALSSVRINQNHVNTSINYVFNEINRPTGE